MNEDLGEKEKELEILYKSHLGENAQFNAQDLSSFKTEVIKTFNPKTNANQIIKLLYAFFSRKIEKSPSNSKHLFDCYNSILFDLMSRRLVARPQYLEAFFFPDDKNINSLMEILMKATSEIVICIYTLTHRELCSTLLEIARRNVKIRIITDDLQMDSIPKMKELIQKLSEFVPIKIDNNKSALMHNKFVVLDRRILITGSFNWTVKAVQSNNENVVVIENEPLAKKFLSEFEKLWDEFGDNFIGVKSAVIPTVNPFVKEKSPFKAKRVPKKMYKEGDEEDDDDGDDSDQGESKTNGKKGQKKIPSVTKKIKKERKKVEKASPEKTKPVEKEIREQKSQVSGFINYMVQGLKVGVFAGLALYFSSFFLFRPSRYVQ